MKTSRSSLTLSSSASSGASDTSKKFSHDTMTLERPKKTKKPGVLAQITRRTKTSSTKDSSKSTEPTPPTTATTSTNTKIVVSKEPDTTVVKKKSHSSDVHSSKMSTLPRMFKPKASKSASSSGKLSPSSSTSSSSGKSLPFSGKSSSRNSPMAESPLQSGKNTLPRNSPAGAHHEASSPPVKRQLPVSKTASLSFNELKKQYQFCLKEVEELRSNMMEMDMRHGAEMDNMRNELYETDSTVMKLREELKTKEAELNERGKMVSNLEARCLKLELEKDRLLMVIECAQRDALTGEKIIPDTGSWQTMMDEAHMQTKQFLQHMELATTRLMDMENQCSDQMLQIKEDMNAFKEHDHWFV